MQAPRGVAAQVEGGVVRQRRLVQGQVEVVRRLHRDGHGQRFGRGERLQLVDPLVGPRVPGDRPAARTGRQGELRQFVQNHHAVRLLLGEAVAQRHAVVVGPEDDLQPAAILRPLLQRDGHLVAAVPHEAVLAPELHPAVVVGAVSDLRYPEVVGQQAVAQLEAERRAADQRVAVAQHAVGRSSVVQFETDGVAAAGSRDLVALGRGAAAEQTEPQHSVKMQEVSFHISVSF